VGESGSGKTTLGRIVVRFERPQAGSVHFDGIDVGILKGSALREFRRRVQMIFQNPFSSLNPRRKVRDMLQAGYAIHGIAHGPARDLRMEDLLERVGLRPDMLERYPHECSVGERQRIVIARALSVGPDLIVADEPVSSLDVSIQAQLLNLMKSIQDDSGITYLMITHDLRVVNFFCNRMGVMYRGRLVETGPRETMVSNPLHPYSRVLIEAARFGKRDRRSRELVLRDDVQAEPAGEGCVYSSRCWLKDELSNPAQCYSEQPPLREILPGRFAACHFAEHAASGTNIIGEIEELHPR
jgi:oligopeptide/dipeptide ABC transporter ATP-binding protein